MIGPAHDRLVLEFVGSATCLWSYAALGSNRIHRIAPPVVSIDGGDVIAELITVGERAPTRRLPNGADEITVGGALSACPDLALELVLRIAPGDPVVRFHYRLVATRVEPARALTRPDGADRLTYAAVSFADLPSVTEVVLSEFQELVHSFCPAERDVPARMFAHALPVMGPILIGSDGAESLLIAYEHGSQTPDAFVHFRLTAQRLVSLEAAKGNYHHGQRVAPGEPFATIWLHLAAVSGDVSALAGVYRRFLLEHQSLHAASRSPRVFYNTWNFQERNKWFNGKTYLASMTQERILEEIGIASRMGVEVFVLDTGWYSKTGDWQVDLSRFPDGLRTVKAKLDGHGMKLGLWFGPLHAARSSRMLESHRDCIMSWRGQQSGAHQIWETEESHNLCLVSRFAEAFAEELIRLVREVGVTYFKWDGIGQYGCDDPHHQHGGMANSAEERADRYAFEQPRAMIRITERLQAACPEAIVDFDITEGGRCVGLAFISAGKYFLINNGPYYGNFDLSTQGFSNIFVNPGQARPWICRTPLTYDRWIPSVLFLTHYLPDDPSEERSWTSPHAPIDSQDINLASLMLGQNGIWGDLPKVSPAGVARFGEVLARYKRVREAITAASPIRAGAVGSSPEIHEKIDARRGLIAMFSPHTGSYDYVSSHPVVEEHWSSAPEDIQLSRDAVGRAVMRVRFPKPGVRFVLFG